MDVTAFHNINRLTHTPVHQIVSHFLAVANNSFNQELFVLLINVSCLFY